MIGTVAANLVDMLWEQGKHEEAEATMYQARQVCATPPPPPPPNIIAILLAPKTLEQVNQRVSERLNAWMNKSMHKGRYQCMNAQMND